MLVTAALTLPTCCTLPSLCAVLPSMNLCRSSQKNRYGGLFGKGRLFWKTGTHYYANPPGGNPSKKCQAAGSSFCQPSRASAPCCTSTSISKGATLRPCPFRRPYSGTPSTARLCHHWHLGQAAAREAPRVFAHPTENDLLHRGKVNLRQRLPHPSRLVPKRASLPSGSDRTHSARPSPHQTWIRADTGICRPQISGRIRPRSRQIHSAPFAYS